MLFLCLIPAVSAAQTYAKHGMVVSDNVIASEVGKKVLEKGGNAIDAAVATAFALAVTHPQAGNIGGGGFLVFMDSTSSVTTIDFREKAPAGAHPEMFLDESGELPGGTDLRGRPTTVNHTGLKSAGVPGTVAGLHLAHRKYGTLPWKELVEPAVELARNGFPLTWTLSEHARFFHRQGETEFIRDFFSNDQGEPAGFGEVWKQPELALTLEEIRDHGRDGFYQGRVAREIAQYMKELGGIITQKDLEEYQAIERPPVKGTYRNCEVYSMAPPSSGGVAMIQMLHMAEQVGFDSLEFNSAPYYHLLAEVMRRAYADRAGFLGDPDFNPGMPVERLISKEYAAGRIKDFNPAVASESDPARFGQLYEGPQTTHLSVVDSDRNAVSLTYTLEYSYGSGMGSPRLGFLFNNEMGDFNPVPGLTSEEGLIGTAPNLIEPGKRMLSSMTPTIVARDGKPCLVIGSPGGKTIINTVFQTVLTFIEYEMPVREAIENVKIHHQWLPDRILFEEERLSTETRAVLEAMGHQLVPREALGRLMGIEVDHEKGILSGAADSSSPDGGAAGY